MNTTTSIPKPTLALMPALLSALVLSTLVLASAALADPDKHPAHEHGQSHGHESHKHETHKPQGEHGLEQLKGNNGEKWASDEHLRRGMEGIRQAFVAIHDQARSGEADAEDYQSLAQAIDEQVGYMFENCQLDAEPDAELHVILSHLMQASTQFTQSDTPRRGMHRVHQTLDAYGEIFQHENWEPVPHHHGH